MDDFTQQLTHISEVTYNVGVSSNKTTEEAENGNIVVEETINQMKVIHKSVEQTSDVIEQLGQRSKEIEIILNTITSIAEQTNLLSLNAAIEAARAGEHGKGFAVVANEVRKLADESSKSVEQIRHLIEGIQSDTLQSIDSMKTVAKETNVGMNLIVQTGDSFAHIFDSTKQVAIEIQGAVASTKTMLSQAGQLTSSIHEMASQTEMTEENTQTVAASTEEQLASMEEITSSVNELSIKAQQLQEMIEDFTL
ncbi:methyl-accepting chemotaxis protein [Bacillus sp. T33-2]|uniref:methyl-accepting chemotaxis protein n=1 Tax=Bacillus sp. T33-2 TaxID=2054168 RepID=UPI0035B53FB3